MSSRTENPNLYGLVDMGSNGIRFSVSDLSEATARILPTLFQDRAGISLYDAQYSSGTKAPIPPEIILDVLSALHRFKRTCEDFGVPPSNISVLATEATREAINSVSFRQQIKDAIGWTVKMLPKEEEGRVGAMGIASSADNVQGLVMDLGGGSMQLTWLDEVNGAVTIDENASVSLPYGAAAVLRRLQEAEGKGSGAVELFAAEVRERIKAAWESIKPQSVEGINYHSTLFLSGGGFRGWGNVLMDSHPIQPYPIPIINGFTVPASTFRQTSRIESYVAEKGAPIFRVSDRRASQIPAVAFLVTQLAAALPGLSIVRFAQGGVREGYLFSNLLSSVRRQIPLDVATASFAPPCKERLLAELKRTINFNSMRVATLIGGLQVPFINLLYHASSYPKEIRAAISLRFTTSGVLAGVHGVSHNERAALALMLCERWGGEGDLSPTDQDFFRRLQGVLTPELSWWSKYVGRIGAVLGYVWPAGVVREEDTFRLEAVHIHGEIKLDLLSGDIDQGVVKAVEKVGKLGKKKNWIGGKEGWGMKIDCGIISTQG